MAAPINIDAYSDALVVLATAGTRYLEPHHLRRISDSGPVYMLLELAAASIFCAPRAAPRSSALGLTRHRINDPRQHGADGVRTFAAQCPVLTVTAITFEAII